jgi:hypothetical protein
MVKGQDIIQLNWIPDQKLWIENKNQALMLLLADHQKVLQQFGFKETTIFHMPPDYAWEEEAEGEGKG